MKKTYWKHSDWNALCDVCGFKFKASDLLQRWDGARTCRECWEQRHTQELTRPLPDIVKIPWTRPEGQNLFITGTATPEQIQAIAGFAVAGWAITGLNTWV